MNETTASETVTVVRNPLVRKALIVTSAAVGVIIAGGLVLARRNSANDEASEA